MWGLGYSAGRGGLGGPEVGPKTFIGVTIGAAVLGVLYLAFKKPDPPGSWREAIEGPKSGPHAPSQGRGQYR